MGHDSDNLIGGRGKCQYCHEMVNNVSYHEVWDCEKRPNLEFNKVESRSVQRRIAAQKGLPAPEYLTPVTDKEAFEVEIDGVKHMVVPIHVSRELERQLNYSEAIRHAEKKILIQEIEDHAKTKKQLENITKRKELWH